MAMDPAHRYASIVDLKADLQRAQSDLPITATRDNPIQALTKWTRRHPTAAMSGAMSVLLLLIVGVVVSIAIAQSREADLRAERAAVEAERVAAEAEARELETRRAAAQDREDRLRAQYELERKEQIALLQAGRAEEAEALLALLTRTETDARVPLLLGLTRRLLGRDDAVDALRAALLDE